MQICSSNWAIKDGDANVDRRRAQFGLPIDINAKASAIIISKAFKCLATTTICADRNRIRH